MYRRRRRGKFSTTGVHLASSKGMTQVLPGRYTVVIDILLTGDVWEAKDDHRLNDPAHQEHYKPDDDRGGALGQEDCRAQGQGQVVGVEWQGCGGGG